MDSAWCGACDCYQVVNDGVRFKLEKCVQIASGPRGTCNVAIASSQVGDAVALFNKEGSSDGLRGVIVGVLQIRFGSQQVQEVSRSHRGLRDGDPISLAFDDLKGRLLSLNHEVLDPEITLIEGASCYIRSRPTAIWISFKLK
jgi:hypothetical protein